MNETRKFEGLSTVQSPRDLTGDAFAGLANTFMLSVSGHLEEAPQYWSSKRDEWLVDFMHKPGSDLLAGTVATLVAKVVAANWYVEGPLALATFYRDILLNQSDFGNGWGSFAGKWTQSYLNRDMGGLSERLRTSMGDRTGPSLGFAHLDESKCQPTHDAVWPFTYQNSKNKIKKLHRSSVMQILDMPSPRDKYKYVGLCSTSRVLTTALMLASLFVYKREKLSDMPPAGIMFINNMHEAQWQDITKKYDARQENIGNEVWRNIMMAFGYDPAYKVEANFLEFSQLFESFDDRQNMEIAVYSFAIAFRIDPRELWPVSSGMMGTATEAELQHRKAQAKGEGIIFAAIERQLNHPLSLPQSLSFRFDFRNDEEDLSAAQIDEQRISNIRRMWEASPNQGMNTGGRPGGAEEDDGTAPPVLPEPVEPAEVEAEQMRDFGGMISTDEARQLLVRDGLIPPEFVGEALEQDRLYDVKSFGPIVRAYGNGAVRMGRAWLRP